MQFSLLLVSAFSSFIRDNKCRITSTQCKFWTNKKALNLERSYAAHIWDPFFDRILVLVSPKAKFLRSEGKSNCCNYSTTNTKIGDLKVDGILQIPQGNQKLEVFYSEEKQLGKECEGDETKVHRFLLCQNYRKYLDKFKEEPLSFGRTCVGTRFKYWFWYRVFSDCGVAIEFENLEFPTPLGQIEPEHFKRIREAILVSLGIFSILRKDDCGIRPQWMKDRDQKFVNLLTPQKNTKSNAPSAQPKASSAQPIQALTFGNGEKCTIGDKVDNGRCEVWRGVLDSGDRVFVKNSKRELNVLLKIRKLTQHSKHIIQLLNYNEDGYFCVEAGISIEEHLNGKRTEERFQSIAIGLLESLAELKQLRILHNDISMNNVVAVDGRVKLIDFETATFNDSEIPPEGTSGFTPDEKKRPFVSDVWSAGAVLLGLYCQLHELDGPFSADTESTECYAAKLSPTLWSQVIALMVKPIAKRASIEQVLAAAQAAMVKPKALSDLTPSDSRRRQQAKQAKQQDEKPVQVPTRWNGAQQLPLRN